MSKDWFKKLIFGGFISLFVSILTYVLTTFASIDYVKDYVNIRHDQVQKDLKRIEEKVDYLIELQIKINQLSEKGDK